MGGHINDIPMIRWLVETSSETEGGARGEEEEGGEVVVRATDVSGIVCR